MQGGGRGKAKEMWQFICSSSPKGDASCTAKTWRTALLSGSLHYPHKAWEKTLVRVN